MNKASPFEQFSLASVNALPRFGSRGYNPEILKTSIQVYRPLHPVGIYIHIPFCKTICPFCMLRRRAKKSDIVPNEYIDALLKELKEKFKIFKPDRIDCLYIGGGTPSVMSSQQIKYLIQNVLLLTDTTEDFEITFEGEAQTLGQMEILNTLKEVNVKRISFGVQTFDNAIRKLLGRTDSIEDINKLLTNAKKLNFEDINIDYMYNLPGTNVSFIDKDFDIIESLPVTSVDCHPLKYTSCSTSLLRSIKDKELSIPDAKLRIKMFNTIRDRLANKNYFAQFTDQYCRLANFKGNIYMQHLYGLRGGEYIGVGAGSRGHIAGFGYTNIMDMREYVIRLNKNEHVYDRIIEAPMLDNYIACFPKRNDLLKKTAIKKSIFQNYYYQKLNKLTETGAIIENKDGWLLTNVGLQWYQNLQEVLLSPTQKKLHNETSKVRGGKLNVFGNYFKNCGTLNVNL